MRPACVPSISVKDGTLLLMNDICVPCVCQEGGTGRQNKAPPQSPHLQPSRFLCQSFACFAFKEFVQPRLGLSYRKCCIFSS